MPIRNRQHDFMGYPLERLDRIVRCAMKVLRYKSEDAMDFYQEGMYAVLSAIYRKKRLLDENRNIDGYLYRVALHRMMSIYSKSRYNVHNRMAHILMLDDGGFCDTIADESSGDFNALFECLEELPDDVKRMVWMLVVGEGYKIMETFGCSQKDAACKIARAVNDIMLKHGYNDYRLHPRVVSYIISRQRSKQRTLRKGVEHAEA
ncbi:MAG: sigma-70 family RNA polymerase sigma factor [Candidatus Nitrosotenuis sp.]